MSCEGELSLMLSSHSIVALARVARSVSISLVLSYSVAPSDSLRASLPPASTISMSA